jgi:galactokinase
MLELAKESFSKKTMYTPQQISKEFDVEDPFVVAADVPHLIEVKNRNAGFELYKRAFHVLSEAKRVHEFKAFCDDQSLDAEAKA